MAGFRQKVRGCNKKRDAAKPSILIIEDQRSLGIMLQKLLCEHLDGVVDLASTLAETNSLLESNSYVVAVADLHLPDANYEEILDTLKNHNVPAVALTGNLRDDFRKQILAKGVVDYILKDSINAYYYVTELVGRLIKNKDIKTLVVDDSKAIRLLLQQQLEMIGLQVITAENGNEALQKLEQHPDIRLILTDYNMPEKNGVELTLATRRKFGKEKLCIIGISDAGGSTTTAHFLKHGANDFIHKPFNYEELSTRVNQNLEMLDLLAENHKAANFDFLTQLFNRRAFFNIGQTMVEKHIAENQTVLIAMLDIDHFKQVNDTYGHDSGDIVLLEFAQIMKQLFDDQITARLGGEEFALIMTGISPNEAISKLENFRSMVEKNVFDESGTPIRITTSIGLISSQEEDDLDKLLNAADSKLYEAKKSGRNRIVS